MYININIDFLSYKIESVQKRAVRIIFPLMNFNEALNALNLTTLCEMRVHLCAISARSTSIDSGMRTVRCTLCSPSGRSLYTITFSDLVLAVSNVLFVELSARKSLSLLSTSCGLYCFCVFGLYCP